MRKKNYRTAKSTKSMPGRLRIVAGKWRSRLLPVIDVAGLRPTPERIRETLFNWLAAEIEGKRCLDLFAGSGALGFEALSRGAKSLVIIEKSADAVRLLRDNIAALQAHEARLLHEDALEFIRSATGEQFDIVFLDPPFADELLTDLCRLLAESGMLAPGARIYLERERNQAQPELPGGWRILKEKAAGNVHYSLVAVEISREL
jgi:16S rRNA (guanine966-N2)-methyltransferase